MKNFVLVAFLIVFQGSNVLADDELNLKNQWLIDFLAVNLERAEFESNVKNDKSYTELIFKERVFNFKTNDYYFSFQRELKQNWDVLTHDGTEDLPRIEKSFPGSRIEPWTNMKGTAVYRESFTRDVPNWMVFNSFSKLLISLAKYNFESPVNSTFYADELKLLKKLQKIEDRDLQKVWAQFVYDDRGQVESFSSRYVKKFVESSSADFVLVENENNETIYIESISTSIDEAISGIRLYQDNKEMIIFNEDLNKMLFRFAPEVFPSPKKVFHNYLLNLAKTSDKGLERFENGLAGK